MTCWEGACSRVGRGIAATRDVSVLGGKGRDAFGGRECDRGLSNLVESEGREQLEC